MAILDALHTYNLRYFDNIEPPKFNTPVYDGTAGSTSYTYVATFVTINGETTRSEEVTVDDCAALTENDTITLSIASIPAAVRTIKFYRKNASVYNYIGTSTTAVNSLVDYGLTETVTSHPPATNTSGRSNYHYVGFRTDRPLQRMELIDQQSIMHKQLQHFTDTVNINGDIITGMSLQIVNQEQHKFSVDAGTVYYDGLMIDVPASGTLTLTGSGKETIGLNITSSVVTYEDDPKLRNLDDGIPIEYYNLPGADRISAVCTWVVNDAEALVIHTFEEGIQTIRPLAPERTKLTRDLALRTDELSGSFVTKNFGVKVVDVADETKLGVQYGPGTAYVDGYRVEVPAVRTYFIDKPRTTASVNNGLVASFVNSGAFLIPDNDGPYDLNGLSMKFKFGAGNSFTIDFTGDGMGGDDVVEKILGELPSYITTSEGFACSVLGDKFILRAPVGKTITVEGVTSDAYTVLGITAMTYQTSGRRIYHLRHKYIKEISDFTYGIGAVGSKVRGSGSSDFIIAECKDIIGVCAGGTAEENQKNCHDGNFTYTAANNDFSQDGDYIVWNTGPTQNTTYYVKYVYNITPTAGVRTLVRVTNGKVQRSAAATDTLTLIADAGTTAIDVSTGNATPAPTGNISDVYAWSGVKSATSGGVTYTAVKEFDGVMSTLLTPAHLDWSDAGNNPSLPGGQPAESSYYYVSFDYWRHDTEGDYVCATSYTDYDLIPQAPNVTWHLRDCIDFRTTGRMPANDEEISVDYEYYLARADRFGLNENGNPVIIYGEPLESPDVPKETLGICSLAVLKILPYCYGADTDVVTVSTEPMRITQAGMREMQKRLDRLEYMIATTVMDADTKNENISYSTSGFFSDSCINMNKVDVGFSVGGIFHNAALDRTNTCFRLPDATGEGSVQYLNWNDTDSENIISTTPSGSVLTLLYQPTIIDSQIAATDTININPNPIVNYLNGNLVLSPAGDAYFSTTQLPAQTSELDTGMQQMMQYIAPGQMDRTDWGQWHYTCNNQPAPPPGTATGFSASCAGGNYWHSVTYEEFCRTTRQGEIWGCFQGQHYQGGYWQEEYDAFGPYGGRGSFQAGYIQYGNVRVEVSGRYNSYGQYVPGTISQADIDRLWAAYYQECINFWSFWGYHQSFTTTQYPVDRDGVRTQIVPERKTVDLGNRVVDLTAVPMMRTKLDNGSDFVVTITANSLMPNAAHVCIVGGQYVNLTSGGQAYVGVPNDNVTIQQSDSQHPVAIITSYQGKDYLPAGSGLLDAKRPNQPSTGFYNTVKTDANGKIVCSFVMPSGVKSGTATVVLRHKLGQEYSFGAATFTSNGFDAKKQSTTLGFTTSTIRRTNVNECGSVYYTSGSGWVAVDPIAQTFFIKKPAYISAVDIYFATKNDVLPVTCDIRKVANGYPTKEVIVSATLEASDITTSADGRVATQFLFEEIKLFQPDEYAIVLLTDCQDYHVYMGTGGLPDLVTGNPYSAQQHMGVLFQSMNNSTWDPINASDMKFRLWQSNFTPYGTIIFQHITGIQAGMLSLRLEEFLGPGTNAVWSYQLPASLEWISFDPVIDKELDEVVDEVRLKCVIYSSGGAYALDLRKSAIILKTNKAEGDYISQAQKFLDAETQPDELVMVMTTFCDGFGSLFTDGTGITPYYSVDNGEYWVEVDLDPDEAAQNKDYPYVEHTFRTPPEATIDNVSGTNNQPMLVTAEAHGFKENQKVYISGNNKLNGSTLYRLSNVTTNTFKLFKVSDNSAVNSDGSTVAGGTMVLAPFDDLRTRINMKTSVLSRTPRFKDLRVIANISQ